jgi:IPT/TIG domain
MPWEMDMPRTLRNTMMVLLLLFTGGSALLHAQTVSATATLTVNSPNGVVDTGNITVDFNGFLETVNYGQYSSPASLAAALGAMFTRDYNSEFGLYAKAYAPGMGLNVVTFQLTNAYSSSFGPLTITGPSTSFTFSSSGFASSSSSSPAPVITGLEPITGPIGTAVTITGTNFGSTPGTLSFNGRLASVASWSNTAITTTVPSGASTGPVMVTISIGNSNGALFNVPVATGCPVVP